MRILIVEDEMVSREKLRVILDNVAVCDDVPDGESALDAFKKAWEMRAPYDVIMLDINLPSMSGMDVIMEVREMEKQMDLPKQKSTKIIMTTSNAERDYLITCMTAGCNGYVIKPFTKHIIYRALHDVYSTMSFLDEGL